VLACASYVLEDAIFCDVRARARLKLKSCADREKTAGLKIRGKKQKSICEEWIRVGIWGCRTTKNVRKC
jgi:hypothetical protein